ncbi:MAG TPA: hypothetical protein VE136_04295 [Anaerolineales bacterium]|nr:hypothetical protein [Anaerolineales bacterium]
MMKRILSRRSLLTLAVLLAIVLFAIYLDTRPRLAPGQAPLADINNIDTLRTQFNQDAGQVRLILLVSPT